MPEDIDGTGTWTVAGWTNPYSPEEWAALKAGMLKRRRVAGIRTMYVADNPTVRHRLDPVAVAQYIMGYGALALILAVVITIGVTL
jgi:hypothetical protein